LASVVNKPNGQFVITPKMGPEFVAGLPVGKFHGVGPATETKLHRLGIFTGLDLRSKSLEFLVERFGSQGSHFYDTARGIDDRPVRPNRIRKSIGAENTFMSDLTGASARSAPD
jgi:DNA polymerase-4